MATPRELEVIRADIMIAKNILYPQDGNTSNQSPYLLNQAAYHSEQAIEKSLKAIIRSKDDISLPRTISRRAKRKTFS